MGALLRTAYYLGIEGVIVDGESGGSCPLTAVVSKASAGAMEHMEVHRVRNLVMFLEQSKLNGWNIVSTVVSDVASHPDEEDGETPSSSFLLAKRPPIPSNALRLEKPTIVCMGSEGFGLKSKVLGVCDEFVNIPPSHSSSRRFPIDSLNVSVATGIILHQLIHSFR
eukprot:TRINITY_DN11638_c0_g1_i2.p1 TRINITY_DN11638_c0_g1~~TRINITY_DN11638_c0_g1_i2.p1  ORF type:complete len:189 (-),score=30.11 TRINITY_DN11638_c0_g1_i2:224-724(-)